MGNSKPKPTLQDVAFDLKFTAKQMDKQSHKIENLEKAERKKIIDVIHKGLEFIFQALNKGQMENAKIYAENVIRNRKEALNLKRFSVKMGALAAKLESAARTQNISETISRSVPMLKNCMAKMDALGVFFL